MDTSLYGHYEPVGLNAMEMMRTMIKYADAKQQGIAAANWDPVKYWDVLIAKEGETPNARWSQNYYFDGVLYEREPSDKGGGFLGSITMSSSGLDMVESKRDLTDQWRSFVHYYGQTPTWDYWDRKGSCQGATTAWVWKRFEMDANHVYNLLTTDAMPLQGAQGANMATYSAMSHAAGVDPSEKVYPFQLAPLAWQPGGYIPGDYLTYTLPSGLKCYDGIAINCGHIFARGKAPVAREGGSDVSMSPAPKELIPFTDNRELARFARPPVDLFLSFDNVHN